VKEYVGKIASFMNSAYTGLSLFEVNDEAALVAGAAITMLTSLHNYIYDAWLFAGEKIAKTFAKVEIDKNNRKGTAYVWVTPTKAAVLVGLVTSPPLYYVGIEMLKGEGISKVIGATIITALTFALGGAVAATLIDDVLAARKKFKEEVESALDTAAKEQKVTLSGKEVKETILPFGQFTLPIAAGKA